MDIIIYGKNAVRESVSSGHINKLYVDPRHERDEIVSLARGKKIVVELLSEAELTRIAKNPSHQGFVAICPEIPLFDLSSLLKKVENKEYPLLLMLDGIEDPHNLGAIIRCADIFGVDGIIIKKRGIAPLNATVAKTSAGAINYVSVAQVSNLVSAIEIVKEAGYWVVAAEGDGKDSYDKIDYCCPILFIIGSEGFGVSRLLKQRADFVAAIPMLGKVNSLNASVSAGILLSEIIRQRRSK